MIKHFPGKVIEISEIEESQSNYAVVVLNRPILLDKILVETLWNNSSINVTVDGGTNRWISFLKTHKLQNHLKHPNLITGDLDSCHPDSLKYFTYSKVVQTVDQDETDFTKCLRVLEPFISEYKIEYVVTICENSGRFDQIIANVNTLHKNQLKSPEISRPVFILSSTSVSWLLSVGQHEIYIPKSVRKMWCALMPFTGPTKVTTEGLKWNLTDSKMEFGALVSTSNRYDGDSEKVKIFCDSPILWSMGTRDED